MQASQLPLLLLTVLSPLVLTLQLPRRRLLPVGR
jgi:hypothetical protein